ncbi:hypothetical protein QUH73_20560, partial [Labilibaculum sp. K2S]|uniref:hypothetical protein n=1 Tax=Labilibaculum sp. K2S TaxID=3056386 RepID=UPI0025A4AE18
GEAAITGATSSTYTMTGTDVGKFIRFGVVPKAATGNSPGVETFSNYTGAVLANEVPTASNVTYTGTLRSFEVLTGTYSYSDTEGDANSGTSFKWYRADDVAGTINKTAIPGAVAATYTLATADVGKYIAYAVTPASLTGNSPGLEVLSAYQGTISNNEAPTATSVNFTGDLFINKTLTGTYTYTDTEGETQGGTTLQWYRADDAAGTVNKTAIPGAVAATYTLTAADVGKYIAYAVTPGALTGNSPGLEVLSAYQGTILNNEVPTAMNVNFTGTLAINGVLTGTYDYADTENDTDDSSTYQWYRADDAAGTGEAAISGATASTYTLAVADVDKYIAYAVTPASSTGTSPGLEVLSAYQGPVSNNEAPTATNVNFTGPLGKNGVLTGTYDYTDTENDADDSSTYQWFYADDAAGTNKFAINGATASAYTITPTDLDKYIAYAVTPASSTGSSPGLEVYSAYQGPVLNNEAPTATNATVSGPLGQDQLLTASFTYADAELDSEGTAIYQWYRADDAAGTNKSAIAGATSSTYTLTADDVAKHIACAVKPVATSGATPGLEVLTTYTKSVAGAGNITTLSGAVWKAADEAGLYTYADARSQCPSGYHLPTKTEWQTVYDDYGGSIDFATQNSELNLTEFPNYWETYYAVDTNDSSGPRFFYENGAGVSQNATLPQSGTYGEMGRPLTDKGHVRCAKD